MFNRFGILGWIRRGNGIQTAFVNRRFRNLFDFSRFVRKCVLDIVLRKVPEVSHINYMGPYVGLCKIWSPYVGGVESLL